jgi:hypothetical protein
MVIDIHKTLLATIQKLSKFPAAKLEKLELSQITSSQLIVI